MRVPGYDYAELLRAVGERDRGQCWVRGLLLRRREAQVAAWDAGQAEDGDTRANWVPKKLLDCDGPWDADHLGLSKSWLKQEYPHGVWSDGMPLDPRRANAVLGRGTGYGEIRLLADLLNDPRNCVFTCRRHHDMRGNSLIVVRRADLPEHVEEFAAELGDRAVARLERDFGRVSPVGSAQARSTR